MSVRKQQSSRGVALRMILAIKTTSAMSGEEAVHCFFDGEPWPFDEVLAELVPGSNDLRATCIALAWLASERWTEAEVLAELTGELDNVQELWAQVERERQNRKPDDDDEQDDSA
jgi:hypothetical protein